MRMHESIKVGVLITKQLTMGVIISFLFFSFLFYFLQEQSKENHGLLQWLLNMLAYLGLGILKFMGLDF